jgi:hypothetical protein
MKTLCVLLLSFFIGLLVCLTYENKIEDEYNTEAMVISKASGMNEGKYNYVKFILAVHPIDKRFTDCDIYVSLATYSKTNVGDKIICKLPPTADTENSIGIFQFGVIFCAVMCIILLAAIALALGKL